MTIKWALVKLQALPGGDSGLHDFSQWWPKIDEPENNKQKSIHEIETTAQQSVADWKPSLLHQTQSGSKMSDDSKTRGIASDQQSPNQSQQYYGTFQGVANSYPTIPPPPPEPVIGFPQPVPPPGSTGRPPLPPHHQRGYQTVTGKLSMTRFFSMLMVFYIYLFKILEFLLLSWCGFMGFLWFEGYAVVEGRPVQESRLPCCGMGIGWLL